MAKNLMDANKNGDIGSCINAQKDPSLMKAYCDANFTDNYEKHTSCMDLTNFCYNCCDAEFGNMFIVKRDECYEECDKAGLENNGDWIWSNVSSLKK